MSALPSTQSRNLRGGLGPSPPPRDGRKEPRPPAESPQEIVDDLIYYHGSNVVNWSEWPLLLAERGLVPGDVSRQMISSAVERARTRTDPRTALRRSQTGEIAVLDAKGNFYPASPSGGREACSAWVAKVRDMADRRDTFLTATAILQMASSRDKCHVGELLSEELKRERESEDRNRGTKPPDGGKRSPRALAGKSGWDRFGNKVGCVRADFNAALTTTPSTVAEIIARSRVKEIYRRCRSWPHLRQLVADGLVIESPPGCYALPPDSGGG